MKASSGPCKTTSSLPELVRHHLTRFVIATILAGVGLLALASPAEAEVVYTKVNIYIAPNSSYNLDLNGDGVTDFTITTFNMIEYGIRHEGVSEGPATGNAVVGAPNAARLKKGDQIGPSQPFCGFSYLVYVVRAGNQSLHGGNWYPSRSGYLGLMFQINGETYYGWALVDVGEGDTATLTGYAYETTPGAPINAGQKK